MGCRANFEIIGEENRDYSKKAILIRDVGPWDEYLTVTHDAESVVQRLKSSGKLKAGDKLYYYDSENDLTEIVLDKDGDFHHFYVPNPQ